MGFPTTRLRIEPSWWGKPISHGKKYKMHIFSRLAMVCTIGTRSSRAPFMCHGCTSTMSRKDRVWNQAEGIANPNKCSYSPCSSYMVSTCTLQSLDCLFDYNVYDTSALSVYILHAKKYHIDSSNRQNTTFNTHENQINPNTFSNKQKQKLFSIFSIYLIDSKSTMIHKMALSHTITHTYSLIIYTNTHTYYDSTTVLAR
jgi:hypothetical protein